MSTTASEPKDYQGNVIVDIGGIVYTVVKSSDVIEADGSKTKKYWQGHVLRSPMQRFFTASSSWRATKDGLSKKVWSDPYYAAPTNVGQSNYRDNEAQAYFEFKSMVNKQTDKRLSEKPLPMLAQKYPARAKNIKFPCAVQPKFDGMRVLYNGDEAWSRGNKPIIPEVFAHLEFDTKGYIVDGELILPGNVKVNKTMEAAKKFRSGVSDQLQYRVYDIVDESLTFQERFEVLVSLMNENPNIILAETNFANSPEQIDEFHAGFTTAGYEGTMIRNLDGKYTINKRSNDLQKYKDFTDAEFEIVDVIPAGGGSSENVGKFVCKTEAGDLFESTATGTVDERREYLVNKAKYIGKFAKVKFREMSGKNNVPFHSNVLEIRETKDGGF